MKKYLIYTIIGLTLALVFSLRSCSQKAKEVDRLSTNQSALLDKATYYRTKDSLSVGSVGALTLTVKELKQHNKELLITIDQLGVKPKRLQSASTTGINSSYTTTIPITVKKHKLNDDIFNTASNAAMQEAMSNTSGEREIAYKTPYIDILGTIKNDSLCVDIKTFDTIVQIVHRVPRKFLFFRYGTKSIRQEIMSKNPSSTIVYTEYLELKKK